MKTEAQIRSLIDLFSVCGDGIDPRTAETLSNFMVALAWVIDERSCPMIEEFELLVARLAAVRDQHEAKLLALRDLFKTANDRPGK